MNIELEKLAENYLQSSNLKVSLLQGDGSDRQIFRIQSKKQSIIAVLHADLQENADFLYLTRRMKDIGLPVPSVLGELVPVRGYLIEDLGEYNLAQMIQIWLKEDKPKKILDAYCKVFDYLPKLQVDLTQSVYSHLNAKKMGQSALVEDLVYFQENFLERFNLCHFFTANIAYELQSQLIEPIMALDNNYFVYRDFQSRNFMWKDEAPVFIDYQSAMLGSRYYDLASLLYASKAGLNDKQRAELLHYAHKLTEPDLDFNSFEQRVYLFIILRRLRSLGSYAYLSLQKGKKGFFPSLAPALDELVKLLFNHQSLSHFSELSAMILQIRNSWAGIEKNYQYLLKDK